MRGKEREKRGEADPAEDTEESQSVCVCTLLFFDTPIYMPVSHDDFSPFPQAFPIQNRDRDDATVQYGNPGLHDGIWLCLFTAYPATS